MIPKYEHELIPQSATIIIFSDAATSSQCGISVGAFLYLDEDQLDQYAHCMEEISSSTLANKTVYKKYISNKSTWSEIKTVIDALQMLLEKLIPVANIVIYTDCQSLCDLISRRKERLKKNNFMTRSGKIHQHAELYKELLALTDKFQIRVFKIKGHDSSANRLTVHEKIFAMLDKMCRQKLRSILDEV